MTFVVWNKWPFRAISAVGQTQRTEKAERQDVFLDSLKFSMWSSSIDKIVHTHTHTHTQGVFKIISTTDAKFTKIKINIKR